MNVGDVAGDYASMTVTEGGSPNGCGYRIDLSSSALLTVDYPLLRVRLRGRGTTPQYRVEVEYSDALSTSTGWVNAPAGFTAIHVEHTSGKTIKYVKLYAKSSTPYMTAIIDYDYAAILKNPPIIPSEVMELDADLVTTIAVSGLNVKLLNDVLLGVTDRRYRFDENEGTKAYDLSHNRHQSSLVNASWDSGGKHGNCISFVAGSSARLDTGFMMSLGASEAVSFCFWVKAASGVSGVLMGFGQTNAAIWNRVQFNWSSDKVRLYVKDDAGNILHYTTDSVLADNGWHQIVGVVDPSGDAVQVYVDGELDGGASGTLGTITIDRNDLTIGCVHTDGGHSNYTTQYIDEPHILRKNLTQSEINGLYTATPFSGASRTGPGDLLMLYLAASSESLVSKLFTGRVIDRISSGDPDNPVIELVCEDLGEILHERTFTEEYSVATQISTIVDELAAQSAPELETNIDTTNRTLINRFRNEGAWSLLEKLAKTATFATGETGANQYVDPGGTLLFKKYGAFACNDEISDGSNGEPPNILEIKVRESLKGTPRLTNDVRVIVFEEECQPVDEDGWTESAEAWSSPDPTDANYPQSDSGDKQEGTASIHFNTTNPGTQYRMRCSVTETDITGIDELRFMFKYGSGLSPENIEVRIQRGSWTWALDYYTKTGITPPSADTWQEITVTLNDMIKTGNPGKLVNNIQIRAYRSSGNLGTGGFLIDKLRFIRNEKAGTAQDSASQSQYGLRTLREIDKTITDLDYADYVAENILSHRKHPLVTAHVVVPGLAQQGYRPPMIITLTSLKDGIDEKSFQIQRARHRVTPGEGYLCELELIASKSSGGVYEPKIAPGLDDLGSSLGRLKRRQMDGMLSSLRSVWV